MLGLPKSTELNRQLPKKAIYTKFNMNTADKEKFDADIKRLVIVNEISAVTTAVAAGDEISSFFVLVVSLKNDDFDEKNIALISKLIDQKMLFILEYEGKAKLALYHTKLIQTHWKPMKELSIQLKGLNLDMVWENVIVQVGDIQIEQGNTLEEQLQLDEARQRLQKQIARLEKRAQAEKQPRKKFELVQEIQKLKNRLGGIK